MSRSLKKGPYLNERLVKRVVAQKQVGNRDVLKTWDRACMIPPEFVGHTFGVYNGRIFVSVYVVESMVGHRLGEFSPTRTFRGHGRIVSREVTKT